LTEEVSHLTIKTPYKPAPAEAGVERFFGLITQQRIRRGVFTSVPQLEAAIHDYLDHHNAHPKPFVWTKSAEEILAKVTRGRKTLENLTLGNPSLNSLH
jgi:hypothetical protein